jgi:hypothetical protein
LALLVAVAAQRGGQGWRRRDGGRLRLGDWWGLGGELLQR